MLGTNHCAIVIICFFVAIVFRRTSSRVAKESIHSSHLFRELLEGLYIRCVVRRDDEVEEIRFREVLVTERFRNVHYLY